MKKLIIPFILFTLVSCASYDVKRFDRYSDAWNYSMEERSKGRICESPMFDDKGDSFVKCEKKK